MILAFGFTPPLATQDASQHVGVQINSNIKLEQLVVQFNKQAAEHKIGAKQPPLTSDEIAASLRFHLLNKDIPKSKRKSIEKIIELGFIDFDSFERKPRGRNMNGIGVRPEFNYNGYHFTCWNINLVIDGMLVSVRTQRISSRELTDVEKRKIRENLKPLFDDPFK